MEWCKVERRSFAKNVIKFPLSQSLELVESLMWVDKEVDNNFNFITLLWFGEWKCFLEKKYFEYLTQNNKIKTGSFKVIKKITKCIQKTKHTSKQGLSMKSGSGNFNNLCSLKSNYSFNEWFRRLCLFMEKGNKHIPIPKFFLFVFVFDIEKNCGVTLGGKLSHVELRQVWKQTWHPALSTIYLS